ncbi:MAG: hypothetical protein KA781_08275, partial [Aquabacterium sp.]|nr:hypothetical protein [Aquabacterium sp.]
QLVARPHYEVDQFDEIDVVGDHHVEIIKAGLSLEDGSFVLPAAEHPWRGRFVFDDRKGGFDSSTGVGVAP